MTQKNFAAAAVECVKIEQGQCWVLTADNPHMQLVQGSAETLLAEIKAAGGVLKRMGDEVTTLVVNLKEVATYAPCFESGQGSAIHFKGGNSLTTPKGVVPVL